MTLLRRRHLLIVACILISLFMISFNISAQIDYNVACNVAQLELALSAAASDGDSNTVSLDGDCQYDLNSTLNIVVSDGQTIFIEGNGAVLASDGTFGIMSVGASGLGGQVLIDNITFTGGSAASGGALLVDNNSVIVYESTFSYNEAADGGAIATTNGGLVTVYRSTFYSNSASPGSGGAIYANGLITSIYTSTFIDNYADVSGGAIANNGTMTIRSSTITENSSLDGGGLANTGTLTIENSIVASNSAEANIDCYNNGGTLNSNGYNLVGLSGSARGCPIGGTADQVLASTIDTVLRTSGDFPIWEDNGGNTLTIALLPGSPAIDQGNCTVDDDQRNVTRPIDNALVANASGGNGCDIGAYEHENTGSVLVDGTTCTLNNAINAVLTNNPSLNGCLNGDNPANRIDLTDYINIAAAANGSNAFTDINGSVVIDGNGFIVDRTGALEYRFFNVTSGGNLTLQNIRLYDGLVSDAGGAITVASGGSLTTYNAYFQSNSGSSGGAISNGGTANINKSDFYGNIATTNGGGAILNTGVLNVTDSDFTFNHASAGGGGAILTEAGINTDTDITSSVFVDNDATSGFGGAVYIEDQIDGSGWSVTSSLFAGNETIDGGFGGALSANLSGVISNSEFRYSDEHEIWGNSAAGGGGAIYLEGSGSVLIENSTISDNYADSDGGGLYVEKNGGSLQIVHSTISNNSSDSNGGGIYVDSGEVDISLSTISYNAAYYGNGGALYTTVNGPMDIISTTFADNYTYDGTGDTIVSSAATSIANSIISGTPNTVHCSGTLTSGGYNIISDFSCDMINAATDYRNVDPLIGALHDNGGPTMTHALIPASPAIDSGNCPAETADQRGNTRPVGAACDRGSYEFRPGSAILVNNTTCTLVDAVRAANANFPVNGCSGGTGYDVITLAGNASLTSAYNTDYNGYGPIGLPPITSSMQIDGAGFTIAGAAGSPEFRHFYVEDGAALDLRNMTLTGGHLNTGNGGSVYIYYGGYLYTQGVTFSNNFAGGDYYYGGGGAIFNYGSYVGRNSNFTANSTNVSGGAIYHYGYNLSLNNVAITNNTADVDGDTLGDGGGLYSLYSSFDLNSTQIQGNQAEYGGGIYMEGGEADILYSRISGNTAASNGGGGALYSGEGSSDVTIRHSDVTGNTAGRTGGGIANGGTLALDYVTVSGNTAQSSDSDQGGGGIYTATYFDAVSISNSTIAFNTSANAPRSGIWLGIYNEDEVSLTNTIVANNNGNNNCADDSYSNGLVDGGFNLDSGSTCTFTVNALNNTNPQLMPLEASTVPGGGGTMFHRLTPGSPAVDAGFCAVSDVDQRPRVPRPLDFYAVNNAPGSNGCDIGSYEQQLTDVSLNLPVVRESRFLTNAEGWTTFADTVSFTHVAADADSDGKICAVDGVDGVTWAYQAPAAWNGNIGYAYGGRIQYNLKINDITSMYADYEVILEGGGISLKYDVTGPTPNGNPSTANIFAAYEVPLDASDPGWRLNDGSNADATEANLLTALGNMTLLRIRGEYRSGADNGCLDVVRILALTVQPFANPDTYSTLQGQTLNVTAPGVLGNDIDPASSPLTAVLVTNVSTGTLTLNANGSFTYVPAADFIGPVTFTYRATNGQADSAPATVTINVNAPALTPTPEPTPPGPTPTPTPTPVEDLANLNTEEEDDGDGLTEPIFSFTLPTRYPDIEWFKIIVVGADGTLIFGGGNEAFKDWFPVDRYCKNGFCKFTLTADKLAYGGLLSGNYLWTVVLYGPESGIINPDDDTFAEIVAEREPPAVPQNVTVDIINGRVVISWDNDPSAAWYQIIIWNPQGNVVFDLWVGKADIQCDAARCSYRLPANAALDVTDINGVPGLLNGDYNLVLRAWGPGGFNGGDAGGVSATVQFELNVPEPGLAQIPADFAITNTKSGSPTFRWTPDPNATFQLLWIGTPTGLPGALTSTPILTYHIRWYSADDMECLEGEGEPCLFTPDDVFLAVGQYEYWVLSWGSGGTSTAGTFLGWTQGPVFNVTVDEPSPAAPMTPTGLTGTTTPSFQWDHVADVTWYNVWVGTREGSIYTTFYQNWYRATEIGCLDTGICLIDPDDLYLPEGDYIWYIQSYNPAYIFANVLNYWSEPPGAFTVDR